MDHDLVSAAEYLAIQFKQVPRVFHSYFGFSSHLHLDESDFGAEVAEVKKLHEQKIGELLISHNIDPEHVEIVSGDLVVKLLEFLDEANCNILVIGALSREGFDRFIIGSTAEKILENIQCDILILKP